VRDVSGSTGLNAVSDELVRKARDGDTAALRDLVTYAYPTVRRWALVHTGDPSEADDLTQDVLVQMIRRLGTYRGSSAFGTWVYAVTRNAAADRRRRANRRAHLKVDPGALVNLRPDVGESPDRAVDRARLGSLLRTFFDELPARQREVFNLADLQGFTSPEIAEMLGIEPVSVRAHLFKARRTLRVRILSANPDLVEDFR
jgi:RNA polymerase sigma-70 factor (ECF subfamily)